ncbi:right-handed parallel beta-helix repeat-containing protein [Streptomyces sp. NPDC058001]|uniref:right-handed parallel beta-helix repeat-containing protein n=1 Tax=Streptomyces sp. NPDC058001 TaxID=3346300 RepID=UPI0036EDF20B
MHRKRFRGASIWLGGVASVAAASLTVLLAAEGSAVTVGGADTKVAAAGADAKVVAAAGATTPFTTVEAEAGTLGGGARVRSIKPGDPPPTVATLETEASGYALVELKGTGDSVTLPNNSGKTANTLVVRASIPDAPNGGGITASLNLYVNGAFRQAITLSSQQAWNYRGATTNPDDPHAGGAAYRFYNEFPVRITGAPVPAGSNVTLRKDSANTAAVYDVDSVDLENVGAARTQPAGSLSVVGYGADPAFGKDSTVAIRNTVNAAKQQGKSVWIPPGKYLTNSLVSKPLDFTGVTVEGAGMWYSTLYRKVPLPAVSWRSQTLVGSGTTLRDLQIDSNAVWRDVGGPGGADYGINASGAGGWSVDRIWTRHTDANWLSGSNGVIRNSRTSDGYGDGFNINNSNTKNPDKLGDNITVQNNFARGTGDDSYATYSDAGASGTNGQVVGAKILNNTAIAPWWANGLRVAGGKNVEVRNNLVNSVSSNSALDIGVFGDTGHPLESATISGNVLIGGGGWNSVRHGVRISSPPSSSLYPDAYTNVTLTDNVMRGALRAGLYVDRTRVNVTLTNNTIDGPAKQGIWVASGVTGTGKFTGNKIQNLLPGQVATQNDSSATFTITG